MIQGAVLFALVAMLAWGFWALFADMATRSLAPAIAMAVSYATSVALAMSYVWFRRGDVTLAGEGVGFAMVAGVFAGIGAIAFYAGLEQGATGIVTTISAMYFVIAALLGIVVLGDSLTWQHGLGIVFAIVAVALLAQ